MTKTILVVDDEKDLRELLQMDLEDQGYQVIVAEGGNPAFELVNGPNGQKIDLIISDMRMPDGTGFELLQKLSELKSAPPIVLFLTGYADLSLEEAYHLGAQGILQKPWKSEELSEKVAQALTPRSERWVRRNPRFVSSWTVALKSESFAAGITAKILNVGQGGFFVGMTDSFPKTNETIEFGFSPTAQVTVIGKGIVRWVRKSSVEGMGSGIGVEILEMEPDQIPIFEQLIRDLKRRSFIPSS